VPDGGHDVAEVQGSDGATFVLVFLCKGLAGVLKLQLLQQHREKRSSCYLTKECVPVTKSITLQVSGEMELWRNKV